MSIRLNGQKSIDIYFKINWVIKESFEKFHTELSNCILKHKEGHTQMTDINVRLSKILLSELSLGTIKFSKIKKNEVTLSRKLSTLEIYEKILDTFSAWFPISTHRFKLEGKLS